MSDLPVDRLLEALAQLDREVRQAASLYLGNEHAKAARILGDVAIEAADLEADIGKLAALAEVET